MREEWNKGYEKGRDDYCCNGDCNQGRDCPLRKKELTDEEIGEMMGLDLAMQSSAYMEIVDKVRAVLRKASK